MVSMMFSVFDSKGAVFGTPFHSFNESLAMRNVAAAVRGGDTLLSKFPEDFLLFKIGTFDDATGVLVALSPPSCVCNLSTLKGSE